MLIRKQQLIQLSIAAASAILALLTPFYFLKPEQSIVTIKHYGFWLTLVTVLLYIFELRNPIKHLRPSDLATSLSRHWPALLIILLASGYLHLNIDRGFKILYDEHTLNSTAMSFHKEGRAFVQVGSHRMDGEVITTAGFVDKRPLLFPFIISCLHQVTGYRATNAFWLNSGLTCLLLTLTYWIVQQICNRRYGILSVILFTSLPLLAQNTTGGGYELLNLCLIAALILSSIRYLKNDNSDGLNLVILTSVLLASTRYESLLYTLVPVMLWTLKTIQSQQIKLTWMACFSPLLLITPLLSYAIFKSDNRFIQTTSDNFFSLQHLPSNLQAAGHYLFDLQGDFSNSILLSTLGCLSVCILIYFLIKRSHKIQIAPHHNYALVAVASIISINTSLALTCYWGAWTDPATSRFALPLQFVLAILPSLVLYYCFSIRKLPIWSLAIGGLFIATFSSVTSTRINQEPRILISAGNDWSLNWLTQNIPEEKNLIISDGSIGIQLYNYPAIPIKVANKMPERVLNLLHIEFYDNIYVVESLMDFGSAYPLVPPPSANLLSDRFILKHLSQKSFSKNAFYRISLLTGLRDADVNNQTLPKNLPPQEAPPINDSAAFNVYLKKALPLIPNI